ncbi:uncharacterized protein LAESUDRAFT_727507 [Laetiporus sulphureus 93-53]|uniref:Velvet domain-containing protein n=1 Tax=Laetiporus sulphureus 93-53 TaxID=1314785 RepID=A0A165DI67_9APHY|nr:uncharacterized protein LAESUDRAFT_727507 [Laetiporus sulphureus 93-53]KZT04936.1 hypothetical protein LAESUDRAFT_727507 [Laetiporus sulphureus 93-53]
MSSDYQQARRAGPSPIGDPISFTAGQYAGRTLRAELEELQKADLGRKYARKDRRPLDPPPVVQFRLFDVFNVGTSRQTEREIDDYDEIKNFGALCHVDLFPIPGDDEDEEDETEESTAHHELPPSSFAESAHASMSVASGSKLYIHGPDPYQSGYSLVNAYAVPPLLPSSMSHAHYTMPTSLPPPSGIPTATLYPIAMLPTSSLAHTYSVPAPSLPPLPLQIPGSSGSNQYAPTRHHQPYPQYQEYRPPAPPDPDIIAYMGDFAIRESSKCTTALVGATFVQSAVVEFKGKKALMFVFSDLAVKNEGTFLLRYRVFNIYSKACGPTEIPILAECYGGPFKIYSTKEFPGLRASTDLTKHISFFGVRLNLRENERRRRKKSEIEADRRREAELAAATAGAEEVFGGSLTMSASPVSTAAAAIYHAASVSPSTSKGKRKQRAGDEGSDGGGLL